MRIRCADHVTPLYPQKFALTSPTGGGRSVGIVRSRTKATEFFLSHQKHDFWKKVTEHEVCVSIFSPNYVWKISQSKKNWVNDVTITAYWSSSKVPVTLVRFSWNLNIPDRLSKNAEISNFMKIPTVGAELFHAERQTDRYEEANSRCSQFCERTYKHVKHKSI